MLVAPNSTLTLYQQVEITGGQNIVFSSKTKQRQYFNKRAVKTFNDLSYVYRNGTILLECQTSLVSRCNFLSFTNPAFENRPIYARITDYQFINIETTQISYAVDWFQTYQHDVDYKTCAIEREHMSESDAAKAKTNPFDPAILELATGENLTVDPSMNSYYSTADHDLMTLPSTVELYGGTVFITLAKFDETSLGTEGPGFAGFLDLFDKIIEPGKTQGYITSTWVLQLIDTGDTYRLKQKLNNALSYLTLNNLTQNIVNMYYVPSWVTDTAFINNTLWPPTELPDDEYTLTLTPYKLPSGYSPKLYRFPFQYIGVINPMGIEKELRYDDFDSFRDGDGECKLRLVSTLLGNPTTGVFPLRYKHSTATSGPAGFLELNIDERAEFGAIPAMPYCTDNYLTYLSSQLNNSALNMRYDPNAAADYFNEGAAAMESYGGTPMNIMAKVGRGLGKFFGNEMVQNVIGAGGLTNAISGGMQSAEGGGLGAAIGAGAGLASSYAGIRDMEAFQEGQDWRNLSPSEIKPGELTWKTAPFAKQANVGSTYHAGGNEGFLPYAFNHFHFEIIKHHLTPAIAKAYDKYFKCNGYKSGRLGIPRVCRFMGVTSSEDMPEFVTVDNRPTTFVQTTGMKVISPMEPISQYIENLFDAGCRFIKGDDL